MFILYAFLGLVTAIIAAAPPGAVNYVVVKQSASTTIKKTFWILAGAGLGEVLLALIALHCTMNLSQFFEHNSWFQVSIFVLFIIIGSIILLKRYYAWNFKKIQRPKVKTSRFFKGFLLAFFNPPVLLFWVVTYVLIQRNILELSNMTGWEQILLFLFGVLVGKISTLLGYGLWGEKLAKREGDNSQLVTKIVGVGLIVLGSIQGFRFFILQ